MISLEEYLEDGGWEGEAREEWSKEFLDNIDTSKDGFLDRAEVKLIIQIEKPYSMMIVLCLRDDPRGIVLLQDFLF